MLTKERKCHHNGVLTPLPSGLGVSDGRVLCFTLDVMAGTLTVAVGALQHVWELGPAFRTPVYACAGTTLSNGRMRLSPINSTLALPQLGPVMEPPVEVGCSRLLCLLGGWG